VTGPVDYSLAGKRIFVAGHNGMVGAAIVRRLAGEKCEVLTVDRKLVDLRRQSTTETWLSEHRPHVVFVAAARVGGILANATYPADFIYDNLMIETNLMESAHRVGVEKLIFLGSSCIYPKLAPQPIPEDALLTGALEPSNEWYAIAKIAGVKLAQAYRKQHGCDFISAMPTNLYGPGDNFDLESSHVLPALIRKAHDAKLRGDDAIAVWGSGKPKRELLHVDDCADAIVHLAKSYSGLAHVNVGSGEEIAILDLAKLVCDVVGFRGKIMLDPEKPDGTPRKLLSSAVLRELGWRPRIGLREGIAGVYAWFLEHVADTLEAARREQSRAQ
jgi:GDP-L-fucose synthase